MGSFSYKQDDEYIKQNDESLKYKRNSTTNVMSMVKQMVFITIKFIFVKTFKYFAILNFPYNALY